MRRPPPARARTGALRTRGGLRALLAFPLALAAACATAGTAAPPLPPGPAAAPTPTAREGAPAALQRAQEALRAGDHPAVIAALERTDSLAPAHAIVLHYLARSYAAEGRTADALRVLERLAGLGALGIEDDTALAAVAGDPRFQALLSTMAGNAAERVAGDTALIVPGPDRIPESIAHDPREGDFYVGSLAQNDVVRVTRGGAVEPFVAISRPGQVVGIRVDTARRWLWVAAAGPTGAEGGDVHAYELDGGRLVRAYALRDGTPHFPNDLTLDDDGRVYVTDTDGAAIHAIDPVAGTMTTLVAPAADFHFPNGIAYSARTGELFVAHMEGISAVDPRSGRRRLIRPAPGSSTVGIDGLYACGGSLVAIQRGRGFDQVIRFDLTTVADAVASAHVLERRHPAHIQPTTGVLVADELYYIANSQLPRLQRDLSVTPDPAAPHTIVLRLPLGRGCG